MAILVAVVIAAWWAWYLASGLDEGVAGLLEIVAASATIVMVFVIHHTQRRTEQAMQLKLDELISALDGADDRVRRIEAFGEGDDLEQRRRADRSA